MHKPVDEYLAKNECINENVAVGILVPALHGGNVQLGKAKNQLDAAHMDATCVHCWEVVEHLPNSAHS
jgi:hypothetical protein